MAGKCVVTSKQRTIASPSSCLESMSATNFVSMRIYALRWMFCHLLFCCHTISMQVQMKRSCSFICTSTQWKHFSGLCSDQTQAGQPNVVSNKYLSFKLYSCNFLCLFFVYLFGGEFLTITISDRFHLWSSESGQCPNSNHKYFGRQLSCYAHFFSFFIHNEIWNGTA